MKIYINNIPIEVEEKITVIQAATQNGIDIPHFCWHPELAVSGNCRMCLVEIGTPKRQPDGSNMNDEKGQPVIAYMPKLQIACNTVVSDGMRINTETQKVQKARQAVMEFLLINHPLDCPICDEAGGCKLQNYSTLYSQGGSRFSETKNSNKKRIKWNDKIIYDAERCISCSRCIRFTRDIMKEDKLTFMNRGDKVYIDNSYNKPLENNYSMNIIDNCPVGALTSTHFRFKARVWEMSYHDTICTHCARGCNITLGMKNGEVLKVSPRYNATINKHWMCDAGRTELLAELNTNRLTAPQVKEETRKNVSWDEAISKTVKILGKTRPEELFILLSPKSSNETIKLFLQLAKDCLKTENIGYIERIDDNFADDILRTRLKAPNTNGLQALNINKVTQAELAEKILKGKIRTLFAIEEDFAFAKKLPATFAKLEYLLLCMSNNNNATVFADVIMPLTTFLECEGTFTNIDNIVQQSAPAPSDTRNPALNGVLSPKSRLDIFGSHNDKWNQKPVIDAKPGWWVAQAVAARARLPLASAL